MLINPVRVWRALEASGARQHYGAFMKLSGVAVDVLTYDQACRCALGWLAGEDVENDRACEQRLLTNRVLYDAYGFSEFTLAGQCPECGAVQGLTANFIWHLNDRERYTFAQIADVIEAHPERYFTRQARAAFGYGVEGDDAA